MPESTEFLESFARNLELEAHLRELHLLLELLAIIIELRLCGQKEPLSETASWLIYEASQRAKKANAIYHDREGDDDEE